METGAEQAMFKGFAHPPRCLAYSADGKALAVVCQSENAVTLVDIAGRSTLMPSNLDSADITAIAFSPDGKMLAASAGSDEQHNGVVRVWDLATGKERIVLRSLDSPQPFWCVAFSPDSKTLATASGLDVQLFDTSTFTARATLTHVSSVRAMAYSPDGKLFATGQSDGSVRLFDTESGRERTALAGQTSSITSITFAANGKTLAATATTGATRVWQLPTLRPPDTTASTTESSRK
jgi:WD40 repeat protein